MPQATVQGFNFPIIKDEHGLLTFLWDAGIDLSNNTQLTLSLKKPDDTTVEFTKGSSPAVTLGATELTDQDGKVHGANQYVTKEVADGDLDQEGSYTLFFQYTDANGVLKTKPARFYVHDEHV